jgi:hypothetical protein
MFLSLNKIEIDIFIKKKIKKKCLVVKGPIAKLKDQLGTIKSLRTCFFL